jgi:hypothetical protein
MLASGSAPGIQLLLAPLFFSTHFTLIAIAIVGPAIAWP